MDTMDEIEALFDPVSYQKGGAVLRMLRAYLLRDARQPPPLRRSLLQVLTLDNSEDASFSSMYTLLFSAEICADDRTA